MDGDSPADTPALAGWRTLLPAEVPAFITDTLLSASRRRPIVAVSTSASTGRPWVDLQELASQTANLADVVLLETGPTTWALNEHLPPKLDVYGGAVRVWWPGLTAASDPHEHPLLFARSAEQGQAIQRRVVTMIQGRTMPESSPAAWKRITEEYAVGDVVVGRVEGLRPFGAFVELLPGARGLVHITELDYDFVQHPEDIVRPGDWVEVLILSLDAEAGRAELSLKRSWEHAPCAPVALEPGGEPFRAEEPAHSPAPEERRALAARPGQIRPSRGGPGAAGEREGRDRQVEALQDQVEAMHDERSNLLRRMRELEKSLRGERDRFERLRQRTAPEAEPASSAAAFLLGVRLAYARLYGEGERHAAPLGRMRVGGTFLERLRALEGVGIDKVLEVCAQVASGTAHQIRAREVHQLHAGEGGAPVHVRSRDGAKAWRCSLQDGTPSARRLHWWSVPAEGGAIVEFASVGVHDDLSIPE